MSGGRAAREKGKTENRKHSRQRALPVSAKALRRECAWGVSEAAESVV